MSAWLITGGAGYIGAHVVLALKDAGMSPVVIDDLSHGLAHRVPEDVPLVQARIQNRRALSQAIDDYSITGVIHLAALKAAGESVDMPLEYYAENVGGMVDLLSVMKEKDVRNFVYSSSAAVYGTPATNPVAEDAALIPENPYGQTKVVGEWLARDAGVAWNLSWVGLRYFNVAGAGADSLGDNSVNNLIPMVFAALDAGRHPQIFGDDYPTPDGTCIRDYIHVMDLADAHILALEALADGKSRKYNLGNGKGYSVREVLEMARQITGREIKAEVGPRRPGDPDNLVADSTRIMQELGWSPEFNSLPIIIETAWNWHKNNPQGYAGRE